MDNEVELDGWTGTWCPQCGSNVGIDEDGCCNSCGCVAVGHGVEEALSLLRQRDESRSESRRLWDQLQNAPRHQDDCLRVQDPSGRAGCDCAVIGRRHRAEIKRLTDLCLELADWASVWQSGCAPKELLEQLNNMRSKQSRG